MVGTKQSHYNKQTEEIIGMDIANEIASFLARTQQTRLRII
jgi:hypothetical protein